MTGTPPCPADPGRHQARAGAATIRAGRRPSAPACHPGRTRAPPPRSDAPAVTDAVTVPAPPGPFAQRLGHAGLIPFVVGALFAWLITHAEAHAFAVDGLAKYAALIISFLGGIHWGLGMRQTVPSPVPFAWAVTASLLAWVSVLMPAYAGLVVQGVLLIACYVVDRKHYRAHGAAAWLTLRFRLTAVASLSCFIAAAGSCDPHAGSPHLDRRPPRPPLRGEPH